MSDSDTLRCALAVAARHLDDATTSDAEREAILVAMTQHLTGTEAELAARVLFHMRESAALQTQMRELLDEGHNKSGGDGDGDGGAPKS